MALPGPEAIARRLLGRTPDAVEPLIVWDHRATFRCRVGADEFICKADEDLVEHDREVDGHRRAAGAGIPVPELVAVEPGALAMRFVPGVALDSNSPAAAWRAAGRVVRRIHEMDPPAFVGACFPPRRSWAESVAAEFDNELATCVRAHGLDPTVADRARSRFAEARALLATSEITFVHGDLQPDHVLLDAKRGERVVAVLDWSDFGAGDPMWDVAVLTLDDEARLDAFAAGYGAGAAPDLARLYRLVRWPGEISWLAAHGMVDAAEHARGRLEQWRQ